jgi:hypothetical protein
MQKITLLISVTIILLAVAHTVSICPTLFLSPNLYCNKVTAKNVGFQNIYENTNKQSAKVRFTEWIKKVYENGMKVFYSVANTVENNLDNILNFFINRNTNANAEFFNSKIRLFIANQRGGVDTTFFLFRLHKFFT